MLDPKEEIKTKLDVVDVVGEYLQLKPAGSGGAFKAVCPFHAEKTPSFHVSRERQIWHCFGCSKGGDIFSFVMDMEGMSFPEALRHLGAKAGVEIPDVRIPRERQDARQKLIEIHADATTVYEKLLADHALGENIRRYVESRHIIPELVKKFQLGAALDKWDAVSTVLMKRGYREQELLESGLSLKRKSGSGLVDRFRNRLMIPLCDAAGHVVAFTARQLPGSTEEDGPKYMNSPETPIYHKGSMLYGLHLAKTAIRSRGEVIIVEGNLDVIASHAAGVENVVGSSGTALTEAQIKLLARYSRRIIFCLDADNAGFKAVQRVFDLAIELQKKQADLELDLRCLIIPEGAGKDPDDVVQKDPELWRKLSSESQEIVEYFFAKRIRDFEGVTSASVQDRTRLIDELLPEIARLPRPDARHLYLLRLSDVTRVEEGILTEMLRKRLVQDPKTAKPVPSPVPRVEPAVLASKVDRAAAFLLGLGLKHEGFINEALSHVSPDTLVANPWGDLYRATAVVYNEPQPAHPTNSQSLYRRLRAWLEQQGRSEHVAMLDALTLRTDELLAGLSPKDIRAEADRQLALFTATRSHEERKSLEAAIRAAELGGQADRLQSLLENYSRLLKDEGEA